MSYGKDMLDKLTSNKTKDASQVIKESTEGTYIGSAIGMGIGLYIGYSRNYSLLMSAFVGAMAGGLITRIMINRK
jgi:hypothetical protein